VTQGDKGMIESVSYLGVPFMSQKPSFLVFHDGLFRKLSGTEQSPDYGDWLADHDYYLVRTYGSEMGWGYELWEHRAASGEEPRWVALLGTADSSIPVVIEGWIDLVEFLCKLAPTVMAEAIEERDACQPYLPVKNVDKIEA
jgi:hypothetical protein